MGNLMSKEPLYEDTKRLVVKNLLVKANSNKNERIDGGFIVPFGVYSSAIDYKQEIVSNLMRKRKISPFYKGLEEWDESWNDSELAFNVSKSLGWKTSAKSSGSQEDLKAVTSSTDKQDSLIRELDWIPYKKSLECPICFLYYPININYTRCCFQPICSECFVEMKRAAPHMTNNETGESTTTPLCITSKPVSCPFCIQENFGIIYLAIGPHCGSASNEMVNLDKEKLQEFLNPILAKKANLVLSDDIRPDWQEKLKRARARALRKATHVAMLNMHLYQGTTDSSSSRQSSSQLNETLRIQMLEEMMMMEAIRMSLEDEEQRTRN